MNKTMQIILAIIAIALIGCFILGSTNYQTKQSQFQQDITQVVEYMYSTNTPGLLSQEFYPNGGVQVVFLASGKRYTMYYTGNNNDQSIWLSVWVRPEGTSGVEDLETFTDDDLNGRIDFGIKCQSHGPDFVRHFYRSFASVADDEDCPYEFYQEWQDKYKLAIADALAALS